MGAHGHHDRFDCWQGLDSSLSKENDGGHPPPACENYFVSLRWHPRGVTDLGAVPAPQRIFQGNFVASKKKEKKSNSLPRRTPSRRGQDPPGPPTEFATHRLGVERGVSPGRSDLFSCVCSARRDIFVRRESHCGSTGRVSPRPKLIANGGIQWCVANARIKSGGLEVLRRRST